MAERELNEAAQHYDSQSQGLGAAFLDEVQRCLGDILEHPEVSSVLVGAIRRRLIRRFPYAILYSIKPTGIRILAVMNLRRRPMYWLGRE